MFPLADGGIYWRTDYSYMDDHSTNVAKAADLRDSDFDDRNLVNTKLGWRNDNWNVSIWGKNLTDDEYATQTASPFLVIRHGRLLPGAAADLRRDVAL